jgi:hypothetical protein
MVQQNTAVALGNLARGSSEIQAAIATQPSAMLALVRLLCSSNEAVQRSAARVIASLPQDWPLAPFQARSSAAQAPPAAVVDRSSSDGRGGTSGQQEQGSRDQSAACAGCGSLPAVRQSHKLCKGCWALRYCGARAHGARA